MSYRIEYFPAGKEQKSNHTVFRKGLLTILCFFLFLTMIIPAWPEAAQLIHDALEPFRPAVMVTAMEKSALSLQEGSGIKQAVKALVQHVFQEIRLAAG